MANRNSLLELEMSNSFDQTQPYRPQSNQSFGENSSPRKSFPWGCLLGGCLGVMLLGVVAVGGLMFAGYKIVTNQIAKYTSDQPMPIETVEASEEEIQAVEKRFEDFRSQFDAGDAPQELVLTIDEINTLLESKNPEMKGHVYIKIVDGDLVADVSVPLDDMPGGKGRYFNGSATLHVELEDGVIEAHVVDATVNGNPVPNDFVEPFRKENLAKGMYDDPETAKALARCESLEIQKDRIVLKVRPKSSPVVDEVTSPDPPTEPNVDPNR